MQSIIFSSGILFSFCISTGLILPLLLPHPSYIACSLMIIALIFKTIKTRFIIINMKLFYALVIAFLLFCIFGFLIKKGIPDDVIAPYIQPIILFGLYIFLLLFGREKDFRDFLKLYVLFCFIMAFFGTLASIIINMGIVDYQDSLWSVYEATEGRATRDRDSHGYSFPYKLGLVLTGSHAYDIVGVTLYRSSGWLHEPASATLFIAPAIILLLKERLFSNFVNAAFLFTICVFWLACAAVSSLLSFIILISFYYFFKSGSGILSRRFFISIIFIFMIILLGNSPFFNEDLILNTSNESLFLSKFSKNGGLQITLKLFNPESLKDYFSLTTFLFLGITVVLLCRKIIKYSIYNSSSFILILLYFFVFSFKGGLPHLLSSPFVLFFIFLFLRTYLNSWNIFSKISYQKPEGDK